MQTAEYQIIDNKLLVFKKDITSSKSTKNIPAEIFNIDLKGVTSFYSLNKNAPQSFLSVKNLVLCIKKPLESVFAFDSSERWRFKDEVNVNNIEELRMNVNMGAIDIVLMIMKGNTKEESKVYPYIKDVFEKITMELDVGDIEIEMETLEVHPTDFDEVYKIEEEEKEKENKNYFEY